MIGLLKYFSSPISRLPSTVRSSFLVDRPRFRAGGLDIDGRGLGGAHIGSHHQLASTTHRSRPGVVPLRRRSRSSTHRRVLVARILDVLVELPEVAERPTAISDTRYLAHVGFLFFVLRDDASESCLPMMLVIP
jgi:hypothetical protein